MKKGYEALSPADSRRNATLGFEILRCLKRRR